MTKLSHANEDYLEAVYMLSDGGCAPVRSVDIAARLSVSKPSVVRAVALLRDEGFVTQEPYGDIFLTEAGRAYGTALLERHRTLTSFFADVLGVEPSLAEEEACAIEHVISEDTFRRWTAHIAAQLDEARGAAAR